MRFRVLLFVFTMLVFFSCKKEEEVENAPILEFVSISPESVGELQDEITLKVKYFDEDGDLGENSSSVKNLFVTDLRNEVKFEYRVKQLAPTNSAVPIEGILSITIDPLLITDGSESEQGRFYITVVDRAGNESNGVMSSIFTVSR